MFDDFVFEVQHYPNPGAIALDPNPAPADPILWPEEPPFEEWQFHLVEDFADVISRDPNIAPLLNYYEQVVDHDSLLAQIIEDEIIEIFTQSIRNDGFIDFFRRAVIQLLFSSGEVEKTIAEHPEIF